MVISGVLKNCTCLHPGRNPRRAGPSAQGAPPEGPPLHCCHLKTRCADTASGWLCCRMPRPAACLSPLRGTPTCGSARPAARAPCSRVSTLSWKRPQKQEQALQMSNGLVETFACKLRGCVFEQGQALRSALSAETFRLGDAAGEELWGSGEAFTWTTFRGAFETTATDVAQAVQGEDMRTQVVPSFVKSFLWRRTIFPTHEIVNQRAVPAWHPTADRFALAR